MGRSVAVHVACMLRRKIASFVQVQKVRTVRTGSQLKIRWMIWMMHNTPNLFIDYCTLRE